MRRLLDYKYNLDLVIDIPAADVADITSPSFKQLSDPTKSGTNADAFAKSLGSNPELKQVNGGVEVVVLVSVEVLSTVSPTKYPTKYPTGSPSKSPKSLSTTSPTKAPKKNPTKSPTEISMETRLHWTSTAPFDALDVTVAPLGTEGYTFVLNGGILLPGSVRANVSFLSLNPCRCRFLFGTNVLVFVNVNIVFLVLALDFIFVRVLAFILVLLTLCLCAGEWWWWW